MSGLLPISVRVPKPLSAAAIYVDETPGPTYGNVLSARFFNDICEPPNFTGCLGMPTGLDQWTTDDGSGRKPSGHREHALTGRGRHWA